MIILEDDFLFKVIGETLNPNSTHLKHQNLGKSLRFLPPKTSK